MNIDPHGRAIFSGFSTRTVRYAPKFEMDSVIVPIWPLLLLLAEDGMTKHIIKQIESLGYVVKLLRINGTVKMQAVSLRGETTAKGCPVQ